MRNLFRWFDTKNNKMIYAKEVENVNFREGSNCFFRLWLKEKDRYVLIDYSVREMRTTQLRDLKGVEVYEGDIVLVETTEGYGKEYHIVEWEMGGFHLSPVGSELAWWLKPKPHFLEEATVVGNIYENLEFLNV